MEIQFVLNDKQVKAEVGADTILLNVLRDLGCKSVKCGCETTNCGLCTVWLDSTPVLSCAVPAMRTQGRQVTTLEGLKEEAEEFGRFLGEQGAEQCGFCSPGMILATCALLRENPNPTEAQIRRGLSGNLCRCTGYQAMVDAVESLTGRER